jgi:hypothetical protein
MTSAPRTLSPRKSLRSAFTGTGWDAALPFKSQFDPKYVLTYVSSMTGDITMFENE